MATHSPANSTSPLLIGANVPVTSAVRWKTMSCCVASRPRRDPEIAIQVEQHHRHHIRRAYMAWTNASHDGRRFLCTRQPSCVRQTGSDTTTSRGEAPSNQLPSTSAVQDMPGTLLIVCCSHISSYLAYLLLYNYYSRPPTMSCSNVDLSQPILIPGTKLIVGCNIPLYTYYYIPFTKLDCLLTIKTIVCQ